MLELASPRNRWRLITDQVMGGVSAGELTVARHLGSDCLRMQGSVSTANNGGFIQMSCAISDIEPATLAGFSGLRLVAAGRAGDFNIHLRTSELRRPWQSYRYSFSVDDEWREIEAPFSHFEAYRTDIPFDQQRLQRVGIVAIGKDFEPDIYIRSLRLL